jgi:class 3 adenylate cyclase
MSTPPVARSGRTLLASILFVDLVGFSRTTVSEQIEVKRGLIAMLRKTLSFVPLADYRLMDTGDGAAIGFLADPEHALYFALAIDARCCSGSAPDGLAQGSLRIGINFGPVKEVFDVNDRPTLIGDGINAAQRIMSFAQPGQITVSYGFFDLVSRLAPEYSGLFAHVGTHDDKHGREHDVYVVSPAPKVLERIRARLELAVAETTGVSVVLPTPPGPAARVEPAVKAVTANATSSALTPKREPTTTQDALEKESDFEWPIALGIGAGALLLLGALVALLPSWLNRTPAAPPPAVDTTAGNANAPAVTTIAPAANPTAAPAAASALPPAATERGNAPGSAPARAPAREAPRERALAARAPTAERESDVTAPPAPVPAAPARSTASQPLTPEQICSSILQKASLGEALSNEERKTLIGCK